LKWLHSIWSHDDNDDDDDEDNYDDYDSVECLLYDESRCATVCDGVQWCASVFDDAQRCETMHAMRQFEQQFFCESRS